MDVVAGLEGASVNYKGTDYTVVETAIPDVWQWQFRIGDRVRTGKTETRLELLARRRAQIQISRSLNTPNTAKAVDDQGAKFGRNPTLAAAVQS